MSVEIMSDRAENFEEATNAPVEKWETDLIKTSDDREFIVRSPNGFVQRPTAINVPDEIRAQERTMRTAANFGFLEGWLDEYYQKTYPDNPVEEVKAREGLARRALNWTLDFAKHPRLKPLAGPALAVAVAACTPGVLPSPQPTPIRTENPTASPTTIPTASPTEMPTPIPVTPSPTAEVTPSPEPTPTETLNPVEQEIDALNLQYSWTDGDGNLERYGLSQSIEQNEQGALTYQGVFLDAVKLGDNDIAVRIALQNTSGTWFDVYFQLSDPEAGIAAIGITNELLAGTSTGDLEFGTPNEIYNKVNRDYKGTLVTFTQWAGTNGYEGSSGWKRLIENQKEQARQLFAYASSPDGTVPTPSFVNSEDPSVPKPLIPSTLTFFKESKN